MDRQATLAKNPIVGRQADTAKKHTVDCQAVPSKPVQAKFPTVDRLAAQTNDQLDIKQKIQWVVSPETYLDWLIGHQGPPSEAALPGQPALGSPEIAPPVACQLVACQPIPRPPVVHLPVARQLAFPQPMVHQPVLCQPSHHNLPLLSLHLQPDLNLLARTLSPQALQYVQLSIQIGQNLLN